MEQYPIPVIGDLSTALNKGDRFSTLDLQDAYSQMALGKDSKKLKVINKHRDLFCFNWLPFRVASVLANFQRAARPSWSASSPGRRHRGHA